MAERAERDAMRVLPNGSYWRICEGCNEQHRCGTHEGLCDGCMEARWVVVRTDDLAWALRFMSVDGAHTQAVKDRLVALVETSQSEARGQRTPPSVGNGPPYQAETEADNGER